MTHRDEIESAIREWGGRDRAELPKHLESCRSSGVQHVSRRSVVKNFGTQEKG
jgi:hypothetical protein